MIIEKGFNLINTSESYYRDFRLEEGDLIFPYINLCLMKGHPLNLENNALFLDYGYLIFHDVALIKKNDQWIYDDSLFKFGAYIFDTIGGINMNINYDEEFKIVFRKGYLCKPESSNLDTQSWAPIDAPNQRKNMDLSTIEKFFAMTNLPKEMIK